jgi:lysophospholipase L1-like esterase
MELSRPQLKLVTMGRSVGLYAVWLALFVLLLAGFDVVFGHLYDRYVSSYGQRNISILLGEVDVSKLLRERPHPYLLWENTPGYASSNGIRQTNNLGYRNSNEFTIAKSARTFRVLTLGGSTTYGYLLDNPDDAWPAQLEVLLNSKLNKDAPDASFDRIEVINGGLNYATSAEQLLHYLYRDRYLKPDLVIIHTGGNDAAPLLFEEYTPDYVKFRPGWTATLHRLRKGERVAIEHSNIVKMLYAVWLNDSIALPYINKQAQSFDKSEEYYIRNATMNEPIGFQRNVHLLLRNIVADGAMPVVFPFVLASDEQFNAFGPEAAKRAAYTKMIRQGTIIALNKHMEIMKGLADEFSVPFVKLSPTQIPIEHFLDHCHLSRDGEGVKAAFLAKQICGFIKGVAC